MSNQKNPLDLKHKTPGKTWEEFFEKQAALVETNNLFDQVPVPPKEFFDIWLKQPLYPEQLKAVEVIFTPDFKNISTDVNELLLMWGEGSGKDFTVVRLLVYCIYWLLCLKSPQSYFGMTPSDPIAVGNCSFNESHAKNIFFRQFCSVLQRVTNPSTGKNWFEEQGMCLREGKSILINKVRFPKNITAYSMSSVRYTAEGKNMLIGVFDEIAEFRFDKAKKLYENITNTALSRFPQHYKIILISYLRDSDDFMHIHYKEVQELPEDLKSKVYFSRKAVWEVRLDRHKEDYIVAYKKDPEEAARRYENKLPQSQTRRFFRDFNKVLKCCNYERVPLIRDEGWWTDDLLAEQFQIWFKPFYTYEIYQLELQYREKPSDELKKKIELEKESHINSSYYLHLDLSRGHQDFAGLSLIHPYKYITDQVAYYVDLLLQIRPREGEINFEKIRKFIFKLVSMGFPIAKVTFDTYQSAEFEQILGGKGITTSIVSCDRTPQPYLTLKDLIYQGLVNLYYHPICLRELKELVRDQNGKIDHPNESLERLRDEGNKKGSKDVSDALAASILSAALDRAQSNPSIITSQDLTSEGHLDRFFKGFSI